MPLTIVKLETCDAASVVLGACHDKEAIDQIDAALTRNIPGIRFGIAFHELSDCIFTGSPALAELAGDNIRNLRVNNLFILLFDNASAKSVLTVLREIPSIDDIYCAASGNVQVIVNDSRKARSMIGLADEYSAPSG